MQVARTVVLVKPDEVMVDEGLAVLEAAYRRMRDAYQRLEVRQAAFWGVSYPEAPDEVARSCGLCARRGRGLA